MADPTHNSNSTGRRILTGIAHGSTPFIATFILIHLSAPALASLGGSSLASQVMMFGREYYQTSFGEKYLVLAPIATHALSTVAKRLLAPKRARRLSSILSLTGYAALCIFVPVHFLTHRVYPSDPTRPILEVGPSELDYEFVKVSLQGWPWRSWLLYVGLTVCVTRHVVEGMSVIWNTWLRSRPRLGERGHSVVAGVAVLPVLLGLYAMSSEPVMVFTSLATRFEAALSQSFVYRI